MYLQNGRNKKMNSKEIKKYLKENGINTKNISIKGSNCGYSESYNITIKDINIDIEKVRKLVQKLESYERDERTGEILEGGNTYIFVNYDYNTLKLANEKYNNIVLDIINKKLKQHCQTDIDAWNNGNGAVRISESIIIYKDGSTYEVRESKSYKTLRTGIDYIAEKLIQLGKLNEVVKGVE